MYSSLSPPEGNSDSALVCVCVCVCVCMYQPTYVKVMYYMHVVYRELF